jgi:hypothetical protein
VLAAFLSAAAIAACSRTPQAVVVSFDEAHGQRFLVGKDGALDLSRFAALFRQAGGNVRTNRQPITDAALADVDVLVVSGAFVPFSDDEITATTRLLERGGRLCVMLHIPGPVDELLRQLDVAISNGVVREREGLVSDDPLRFRVTRLQQHPLMLKVEAFTVMGAWALMNLRNTASIVAATGPNAWVDLNRDGQLERGDAVQAFGMAVVGHKGRGRFVVFGDDAIFQNEFLTEGNLVLGENLARWLVKPES